MISTEPWFSPEVTGTRPPPCAHISLTMTADHQAVFFGGQQFQGNGTNDVYLLNLAEMVSEKPVVGSLKISMHSLAANLDRWRSIQQT